MLAPVLELEVNIMIRSIYVRYIGGTQISCVVVCIAHLIMPHMCCLAKSISYYHISIIMIFVDTGYGLSYETTLKQFTLFLISCSRMVVSMLMWNQFIGTPTLLLYSMTGFSIQMSYLRKHMSRLF